MSRTNEFYLHLPLYSLVLRVVYLLLSRSVFRSSFRFPRMWEVVQAHSHPPVLGGRLHFQLKWSTASESMYIGRDFADMNCMFSRATRSSLTLSL